MKKILVVDDEASLVLLLNSWLRAHGYDVVGASDPIQGLRLAIEEKPDAIILDYHMPAGGGDGLFDNLRANVRTAMIPILFMTATPSAELREVVLEAGAAGFIAKPVDRESLLDQLRIVLGSG